MQRARIIVFSKCHAPCDFLIIGNNRCAAGYASAHIRFSHALHRRHPGTYHWHALRLTQPFYLTTLDQSSIISNYLACGFECVSEVHLGIIANTDIGKVPVAALVQHCDAVCSAAASPPDAIILLCTNLTLHGEAAAVEQRTQATVLDSVHVTLWHTLQLLGVSTQPLAHRFGRLFALELPQAHNASQ
jgi:hypothetical protein